MLIEISNRNRGEEIRGLFVGDLESAARASDGRWIVGADDRNCHGVGGSVGAGANVSGQVLVYQDLIGLNPGFKPKFLRVYANAFEIIRTALYDYNHDVKAGLFPSESESYYESRPLEQSVAKESSSGGNAPVAESSQVSRVTVASEMNQ